MLDRQAIGKLLKEQNLSLSGLVSANRAVQVGKILSADLLAVLETANRNAVGFVVFDTVTGIKYVDHTLPDVNLPNQVIAIAKSVSVPVQEYQ